MENSIYNKIQNVISLIFLENDVKKIFVQSEMKDLEEMGINGKIAFLKNHNDVFFKHSYEPLIDLAYNFKFMPNTDYFTDELTDVFKKLLTISSISNESNKRLAKVFYPFYSPTYVNNQINAKYDFVLYREGQFPAETARQIIETMIQR